MGKWFVLAVGLLLWAWVCASAAVELPESWPSAQARAAAAEWQP